MEPEKINNATPIEELTSNGFREIVEATKAVNLYPQGASRDLYCSYPSFGKIIDYQSDRILGLISKVLKEQNIRGNIQRRQPDEQFEMIQECNDALLEGINTNLDEMAGIRKDPEPIVIESRLNSSNTINVTGKGAGSWNLRQSGENTVSARLITAKNIERPQTKFRIPVDNSSNSPFIPLLKEKPNSLKPLAVLPEYDETGNVVSYLHPYEFELLRFEVPNIQLQPRSPKRPPELRSTEYMYVDNVAQLHEVVKELKKYKEIAIDVEHHSYRTFLGFTCLVQISTCDKDYLFDALKLREEMHVLNDVTTDPKIIKILHGADLDIEWLQRDLSIYIVNMFDTHQAAKLLNFPRLSLSFLLKHYCDIEADKTFQLADWRMRPLPEELITYARQDTHFLIYIFDSITNALLDAANMKTNLLASVYQRSTEICKKRFSKPIIRSDSYMDIFRKSKRIFDNRQVYALREIFQWRDTMARVEDESYGYVLPNHMMLQIAESLPREMQGILACCNPIPPLVRQHLLTLHQIILRARDQPLVKPILQNENIIRTPATNSKDYSDKLYCPHDLTPFEEFRDDLPCLLEIKGSNITICPSHTARFEVRNPALGAFVECSNKYTEFERMNWEKQKLLIPYQSYLAVLPSVEKEQREEVARLQAELKNRQLCPAVPILPIKKEEGDIRSESAEHELDIPIKELLKRKYAESVNNKAIKDENLSKAKRFKNSDNSLNTPLSNNQPQNDNHSKVSLNETNEQNNEIDADVEPMEVPCTSLAQQKKAGKNRGPKKKKFNMKNNHAQSSNKPVQNNFDYKNVDFRKFKGGAQRAKGAELKPQFHGKNKSNKANDKKFNKLFTFTNKKGNRK